MADIRPQWQQSGEIEKGLKDLRTFQIDDKKRRPGQVTSRGMEHCEIPGAGPYTNREHCCLSLSGINLLQFVFSGRQAQIMSRWLSRKDVTQAVSLPPAADTTVSMRILKHFGQLLRRWHVLDQDHGQRHSGEPWCCALVRKLPRETEEQLDFIQRMLRWRLFQERKVASIRKYLQDTC